MKERFLLPFIALACAVIMTACSGGNKSEKNNATTASEQSESGSLANRGIAAKKAYLDVLPSDAYAIIKLDLGNLLDKSDILKHKVAKELFERKIAEVPENIRPLLRSIYDNPNNSGINVKSPVYLAITNVDFREGVTPSRAMLTMAVSDVKALEKTLSTFLGAMPLNEKKNNMTYVNTGDYRVEIAYDADRIVIAVDEYRARVTDYLNLAPEAMAVKSIKYEQLFKEDKDFEVAVNLLPIINVLMNNSGMYEYKVFAETLMSDYALFASLDFAKGSIDFVANSNIPDAYTAAFNKFLKKSTKRHFEYVPHNSFAVLSSAVELRHIDITPVAKMKDLSREEINEVNALLREINGDLTFAAWINGYNMEDRRNLQFMVALDCRDYSVFEVLTEFFDDMYNLKEVDKDVYALNVNKRQVYNRYTYEYEYESDGYDYYLMYRDGAIMIMPENLYDILCYDTEEFRPLKKNIFQNKVFASMENGLIVDPTPIREILSNRPLRRSTESDGDKILLDVLGMIKKLTVGFEFFKLDVSLELNDGNTNSLKAILNKAISIGQQVSMSR